MIDLFKHMKNKKVLLRERKRHTARRVAVASACYSGEGVPRDGVPPRRWGTPPSKVGVPPPVQGWIGYPPPPQSVDRLKI